MIPIVIVENIVQYLLIVKTNLPEEGLCGLCVLSSLLQVRASTMAGFWAELPSLPLCLPPHGDLSDPDGLCGSRVLAGLLDSGPV